MDSEDSFNEEISSFNRGNVLGDWDQVGEPSQEIQHNQDWFLVVVGRKGSCKVCSNRSEGF